MGAINREWHVAHRMPVKPSALDRGRWHFEHQENCACRMPSDKEQQLIEAYRDTRSQD